MSPFVTELHSLGLSLDAGILAGGLSTRMNGLDKGLQTLNSTPLIEPCLEALRPFSENRQVMISCNRNETDYRKFSSRTYGDVFGGFLGPLAGIHSLLTHSDADYLLISPCDTPFISSEVPELLLGQLLRSLKQNPSRRPIFAAMHKGKRHPLHACIPKSALPSLERTLQAKHSKVVMWLDAQDTDWVDFSNTQIRLDNINSIEQLSRL